jgi:hypothetical protein
MDYDTTMKAIPPKISTAYVLPFHGVNYNNGYDT